MALFLLSFNSCSHTAHHRHDHVEADGHLDEDDEHDDDDHMEHEHDGHKHGIGAIVLAADKAAAAGIVVDTVSPSDFHGVIHTSGRVLAASCDETTVVATTSGRIYYSNHISEGISVTAGSKLLTIVSSDMLVADGDPVQRARINYEKAKGDFERAQQLVKDKIISEKDFLVVKAEYDDAKLTYTSVSKNRSANGSVLSAPKSGFIKQCLVGEGHYVEAGQPLMIITQNKHLYLRAEVPERRFSELALIKSAKFKTSYSDVLHDISEMNGHIQSYGRSAQPGNPYIPVTFEFNNTGNIVQGSFADVYLITGKRQNVLSVPVDAVTEEQGVLFLYIKVDDDEYRKQEVSLGQSDGQRVEVVSGLKGGEAVVVKGAVQIKLASASNAIPAHTHNH